MRLQYLLLAILIHGVIITLFFISWQHTQLATIHDQNPPTVWLVNKLHRHVQSTHKLQAQKVKKRIDETQPSPATQSQTNRIIQPTHTTEPQSALTNDTLIKLLHDQIAAELLQNISKSSHSLRGTVSLLIDFDLDSSGQISQVIVQPEQTPVWLKNLVLDSISAVSPIHTSTTLPAKSHYEIPITLVLSE